MSLKKTLLVAGAHVQQAANYQTLAFGLHPQTVCFAGGRAEQEAVCSGWLPLLVTQASGSSLVWRLGSRRLVAACPSWGANGRLIGLRLITDWWDGGGVGGSVAEMD